MKHFTSTLQVSGILLLTVFLSSCANKKDGAEEQALDMPKVTEKEQVQQKPQLPMRYQRPAYMIGDEIELAPVDEGDDVALKVGATIRSTTGPQPLWDILKRLAAMKDMNVSWESDVDQKVLVDVDIRAGDDFYKAIDNLLRQVDYFHEMQGDTIVVKYKETKQYHIAMPFIKQTYKTNTGGDVLGGSTGGEENTNVAGEISLMSDGVAINQHKDGKPGGVEFNVWNSIENNLNAILDIWTTKEVENTAGTKSDQADSDDENLTDDIDKEQQASPTFRRSSGENTYYIDKPVGLITVTAPRPLIEKLDAYFKSLKKELYKQVAIEAKIIEVQLRDESSIGLDWNRILENLNVSGGFQGGDTYSKNTTTDRNFSNSNNSTRDITNTTTNTRDRTFTDNILDGDSGTNSISNTINNIAGATTASGLSSATIIADGLTRNFSGAISLAAFNFDEFLNAVSKQGQTNILSNPKLSVLNGQPALMTVGRNVAYIDTIETDVEEGVISTSITTARALSGVGFSLTANILANDQIILNLVPVTSELEEIVERTVGNASVGLPIISVREMSTTVKVQDGEMLVIGGLISSNSSEDGSFIPGTSNLPFFKYLFGFEEKTKDKRELIILLRPRII